MEEIALVFISSVWKMIAAGAVALLEFYAVPQGSTSFLRIGGKHARSKNLVGSLTGCFDSHRKSHRPVELNQMPS